MVIWYAGGQTRTPQASKHMDQTEMEQQTNVPKYYHCPPNFIPEFSQFVAAESKLKQRLSKDKAPWFNEFKQHLTQIKPAEIFNLRFIPPTLIKVQSADFPPIFHQRSTAERFQWRFVLSTISTAFPCMFPGWMLISKPSAADVRQFSLSELGGAPHRPTANVHIWFFSTHALVLDTVLTSSHAKCITWRQCWGQLVPDTLF